MPWVKLNEEIVDEIVARYVGGETCTALALEFGVSSSLICQHVKRRTSYQRPRRAVSRQQARSAYRRWIAGEDVASIAREMGFDQSTLAAHVRKLHGGPLGRIRTGLRMTMPPRKTDLAYLAAIIDGEGCISRGQKGRRVWQLTITNTSGDLKDWLKPIGGSFYPTSRVKRIGSEGYRQNVWVWKVTAARDALQVLEAVAPFMVIKRKKAEQAVKEISTWLAERRLAS